MTARSSFHLPLSLRLIAAGVGLLVSVGCSSNDDLTSPWDGVPAEEIYNTAEEYMRDDRFTDAAETFAEVERQYPYSQWLRSALVKLAYANYSRNEYDQAILDAQRYIALFPADENVAYAYYLIALCHYERILITERDQQATVNALAAFDEIITRFPETPYARDSILKRGAALDQLAGHEMAIGRYYLNNENYLSAIGRFQQVVTNYQQTAHSVEALARLVEAYLALGLIDEARRNAAILGHNYPDSDWYQYSYNLVTQAETGSIASSGGFFAPLRRLFYN